MSDYEIIRNYDNLIQGDPKKKDYQESP